MKYFIFFCISITILFSNKDRFLTPQNYNTWVIKEPALKELIYEEIEYFIKYNSEDSLNIIKSTDQFIIIESKKQRGVIYELRYGQDGKYQFIDKKLINWVLPEKLRTEIINKDYKIKVTKDLVIFNKILEKVEKKEKKKTKKKLLFNNAGTKKNK